MRLRIGLSLVTPVETHFWLCLICEAVQDPWPLSSWHGVSIHPLYVRGEGQGVGVSWLYGNFRLLISLSRSFALDCGWYVARVGNLTIAAEIIIINFFAVYCHTLYCILFYLPDCQFRWAITLHAQKYFWSWSLAGLWNDFEIKWVESFLSKPWWHSMKLYQEACMYNIVV